MDVDEEGQAHLEEEDGGEPEVDVGRIEVIKLYTLITLP